MPFFLPLWLFTTEHLGALFFCYRMVSRTICFMENIMVDSVPFHKLLMAASSEIPVEQASELAWEYYGLKGEITALPGEWDSHFRLKEASGRRVVLKFINPAQSEQECQFHTQLLQHLQQHASDLPLPRLIANRQGELESLVHYNSQPRRMRVLSYLPGMPLSAQQATATSLQQAGAMLARLDLALAGFQHEGAGRQLLWDLPHVSSLSQWLSYLCDGEQRRQVAEIINCYCQRVLPHEGSLRMQVIHNDVNPQHLLFEGEQLVGINGLGDALQAPLINELATALAYQLGSGEGLLKQAVPFLRAYHQVLPLTEQELRLLPDLLACRLAMIITIAQWRAARYPQQRDYLLRNVPRAWHCLQQLTRTTAQQVADLFCQVCLPAREYQLAE